MNRLLLLLILIIPVSLHAKSIGDETFSVHSSQNKVYEIAFPKPPTLESQENTDKYGNVVNTYIMIAESNDIRYTSTYFESKNYENRDIEKNKEILKKSEQAFLERSNGEIISKTINDDYTKSQFIVKLEDGTTVLFGNYLKDNKEFAVVVSFPSSKENEEKAQYFMDSFRY